jgi:hypothetical protein
LAGGFAILDGPTAEGFAVGFCPLLAMGLDQGTDIDRRVTANNDVLSAGSDRVTGADRHGVVARIADDLESAYRAGAVQITIVEPILRDDVVVEAA